MTIWDKAYKNYQKDGQAWVSLLAEMHPLFKKFLSKSKFKTKQALDIGCGVGRHLSFLASKGFKVDGIDSSSTAVKMTKDLLGKKAGRIKVADMFKFRIAKDRYDLIISFSTIHHGFKKDIQNLVDKIHTALVDSGKIFITVPDLQAIKKKNVYVRENKPLKNGSYIPTTGTDKGLVHSYYTKAEVQKLFSKFKKLQLDLDDHGKWVVRASK
ncbi:MAG: hypothetical protein UX09_C0009G0002 [Candidatus Uhrbacteria bacterium GW2011_GWE2_45_35]|uniref:Methyltransferase type 11 n=1 Tax=Candidatus Uhrbacteria bacterium GW2011_GWE2_45_35 TaxID=1618993 RepID=A0A0G1QJN3_9BACT|nr:MAG: hypothetical protein UX09_C0009G0002 [Candidatus Uhrbacteria bacterium GW2011_GWE2_45_35]HBR80971.1 hypothetical protein [Candidatus Uhrbacteria bacterium]HCU31920.1 hypothetical protein [Candidatus Uhrbacteria bacterium]